MTGTTIFFSCLGCFAFVLALIATIPSDDNVSLLCKTCLFLWSATLSVGLFVVAAHPWWVGG